MNLNDEFMEKIERSAEKLLAMEAELSAEEFAQQHKVFERQVAAWLNRHKVYVGPKFLQTIVSGAIGAARMKRAEEAKA